MLRRMADLEGSDGFAGWEDVAGPDATPIEQHRSEAIERLKRHAVPGGALSAAALADRVRRVYLAQTRVGIDQVLADLPADPPWALSPGLPPVPGQPPAYRMQRGVTSPWRRLGVVLGALALVAGVGVVMARAATDDGDEGEQDEQAEPPQPDRPASTLPPLVVPDAPATTEPPPTTTVTTLPAGPDLGGVGYVEPVFVLQKVGQDIAPGRYLSTPELSCYWERVEGFGGTLEDVIANGGSLSGRHVIVDVLASDAGLRSQGCDFRPYAAPAAPATTFGDGDWLVGSDVVPGTYRLTGPAGDRSMCAWERATNFTFGFEGGVIDYAYPAGDDVSVQLGSGERFTSMTCGTWTLA
jgi:hypothetical protein